MKIQLIALDMDGTLLDEEKKISPENRAALQKAQDKGVKIVLCTGRPLKGIQHYLEELGLTGPDQFAVTYNGGVVQEVASGKILYQATIPQVQMDWAYQACYQAGLPLNMIDMTYAYETTYPSGAESLYPKVMSVLDFQTKNPGDFGPDHVFNKAVICFQQPLLDERLKELDPDFFQVFNTVKSRPYLLEVLPQGVSKGEGLRQLSQVIGIPLQAMMACGDEENDLTMLESVGIGVAMANGTDQVKAAADYVTASNLESGVAQAIEKFVLGEG